MSKWQQLPLESCMSAIIDYRGKTPTKTDSGVPLITAKIIKGGRIEEPSEFVSLADYDSWMVRGLPKPGDVVLTTEAPLGEVAQLDNRKVALAQRVITLRGKDGFLDNTFLKYLLQTEFVRSQLFGRASGSTVTGIKQSELRKVLLPVPSFKTQRAISRILGDLDEKIELNRQITQTLEQTAQVIFKSWFIDFEPVKAKIKAKTEGRDSERAAMCAISGKSGFKLDHLPFERHQYLAAIAALFPDELVESELGLIPKGWFHQDLTEICKFTAGSAFKLEYQGQPEYEYPFIKVSDMNLTGNEIFIRSAQNYVCESQRKSMRATLHPSGATVFAKIGVALLSNRRRLLRRPTIIDNNMMSATPRNGDAMSCFLYLLLNSIDFTIFANGTALPYLNVSDLQKIQVVAPSIESSNAIWQAFNEIINPLFESIYANSNQSETLTNLRDSLLPKLLSGEVFLDKVD